MAVLRTTPRSALSLERKLPILIGGLVTLSLITTLLLVQWELRSSAVDTAAERLQVVGTTLQERLQGPLEQRALRYDVISREPALAAYLLGRSGDAAAVREVLESIRSSDDTHPAQLRNASGRVVAATSAPFAEAPVAAQSDPPRSDVLAFSPFEPSPDGASYWMSLPVRQGGSVIGHVTQLRTVRWNGNLLESLRGLIGTSMELYLVHEDGESWASVDGTLSPGAPSIPHAGEPFRYEAGDGTLQLAHAVALNGTPWLLVTNMPMTAVTGRMDAVLKRIAVLGLVLLVLGFIAAWWVSRSVTRPLRQLGGVADAIAAGDYSRRAHFDRHDEIGRLARSFDAMAARVDATHAELQRRFREAQALAAELELANARLQAAIRDAEHARTDAQQASRAKSEFLATMSHEIRTPINAIVGYTDLLDLGIAGALNEQQNNYVDRIRMSSEHLTSVVNDVLDFAKIESGQMRIGREVRSVRVSIDSAVTMLQAKASEKKIRVAVAAPIDAVYLGDTQRVQQILLNLLSNALKFTQPGGSVAIECEHRESRGFGTEADCESRTVWTCIAVRDTGAGIAPDQMGPIFEPFVQGAGGYTRPHGGTGLGLAISRSLARMMDGDLTVESEVGAGSTFTLWLPHPSTAPASVS